MKILPSLLASDPLSIKKDIEKMIDLGINTFHIDIMDYHFTPNFGLSVAHCKSILAAFPDINLDVHLMMDPTPLSIINELSHLGIKDISLHPNTLAKHDFDLLFSEFDLNIRAALLPNDPVDDFLQYPKLLFLAVNPGFCGQKMQISVLDKLAKAKSAGIHTMLDGGINLNTIDNVIQYNPEMIVVGGGLINQSTQQQIEFVNKIKGLQD